MDLAFAPDDPLRIQDRIDYQDEIQPNVYLVLHLKDYMIDENDNRLGWTVDRADRVAYKFVASVSRSALGKSAYRNRPPHRKRLPNLTTLEHQGGYPHLNIFIRRPERCSFPRFEEICRAEFDRILHFRHTPKGFYCRERTGDCGPYSLKAGSTILERSMSFCS